MCIRFQHDDVREMGRQAYGVIGIRLDEGDYVVSMIASTNENDTGAVGHRRRIRQAHQRR